MQGILLKFTYKLSMKKIYIAGKVTGTKIGECTMKFGAAQKEIEALGFEAVNPLEVVNDWHSTWNAALRKCVIALMDCDAMYILPCATNSPGAGVEMKLAADLSIPMYGKINSLKKLK